MALVDPELTGCIDGSIPRGRLLTGLQGASPQGSHQLLTSRDWRAVGYSLAVPPQPVPLLL